MTTPAYPTITDELLAELESSASAACQYSPEDWFPADVLWTAMEREDAAYVATAKPWTILALLQHVRELKVDVDRYHKLRTVTPYRFKKIQDGAITDGGDIFYFHSDRFDEALDASSDGLAREDKQ